MSRWPARLPLSTDDTYCGLEPAQVARVVPVVEVAAEPLEPVDGGERRLEALHHLDACRSSRSRGPSRSPAGTSRCSSATCDGRRPASGSSWKLSGGRPLSSGPTNVSKNSHVRRAVRRSVSTSAAESCSAADSDGGRLTHRATSGDSSQSTDERRRDPGRVRLHGEDEDRRCRPRSPTPPAIWR